MSTHNMFSYINKKNIVNTPSYLELCHTEELLDMFLSVDLLMSLETHIIKYI